MTEPLLPTHERRGIRWLDLLAVALVVLAVFMPVLRTRFAALDDIIMIVDNEKVTRFTWDHFWSHWSEPSFRIYMPLALSTWSLITWLTHGGTAGGADFTIGPFWFKVVSVGTHVLAAVAATWLIAIVTRTRWPAVMGGLLFALHPLQVESVAWTTGLKDEYCGLFTLLALGCYAQFTRRDPPTPFNDRWWWMTFVAAVLAVLSKPTAMVLPVLLLAVDWTMRRTDVVRRFTSLALFLIPAGAIAVVILVAQGPTGVQSVAVPLRPLVAADSYAFYLAKLFWPADLSIDYGRRPTVILNQGVIWWTWLLPAVVLVGVLVTRSRYWVLAAVLFVVPVLPVSGITVFDMQQYSTVADHYMYQPLAGAGLALALLVRRWPRAIGAAMVALVLLAAQTYRTSTQWGDYLGMLHRMVRANSNSWMIHDQLGTISIDLGDLAGARSHIEQSLQNNPKDVVALDNQSSLQLLLGDYRQAADTARSAAESKGMLRFSIGRRLTLLGAKLKDIEATEKGLEYWLKAEPTNSYVQNMLANVRRAKRAMQTPPTPSTVPTLPAQTK
jgi:hypothetical protein